ncbi:MAG: Fe2+-dependent dioxygenase [Parvularculaceae bacterium]
MFHVIDEFLAAEEVARLHALSEQASFVDVKTTNPDFAAKRNLQADPRHQAAQQAAAMIREAIRRNEWAMEICRPKALATPMLARYEPGISYVEHIDTAIIAVNPPIRVDISCTVFLSDPAAYDGGELTIRPGNREMKIKEPAGAAIFYPSTTFHQVAPVTRGVRLVALTFIESHVRDPLKRQILYELEELRHTHARDIGDEGLTRIEFVRLNLMRLWAGD